MQIPSRTDLVLAVDRARSGAAALRAPAPVIATAVSLVTLGFGVAFAFAAHLDAPAAPDWPGGAEAVTGAPGALAVIGGLLLGLPLATAVLHRELARPLRAGEWRDDGSAARYVYAPEARRTMTVGLAAAYGTAAVLTVLLAARTGAGTALRALLAY